MFGSQKVPASIADSSGQSAKAIPVKSVNNISIGPVTNNLALKPIGNERSTPIFSEKNNPPTAITQKLNLNQLNNVKIADLPVHTMKKDLENLASNKNTGSGIPVELYSKQPRKEGITGAQKTSPFLNPENKPTLENRIDKEIQSSTQSQNQEYSFWGKIVTIAIIAFVILSAGIGGYYFWITRQKSAEPVAETPAPPVVEEPTLPFSIDKPNYLNIDLANSDSDKIKQLISQWSQKVVDSKITSPIEFIVSDLQNNPINFEEFTAKAGITLPIEITSSLNNSFGLFIFSDNGKAKIGFSVDSQDDTKLKSALFQEETELDKDFDFLLSLSNGVYSSEPVKSFNSSLYKEAEVRYLNLISPEELSIDYTVYNNKFILGTTKLTLRSIVDYLDKQVVVKGIEDVSEEEFLNK